MRKAVSILICLAMVVALCCAFTGCNEEKLTIVYLGDSIAEAILGPSPLCEREDMGYYGIVGQRNDYTYINRAVSGHQTKNMLQFISTEDNSATRNIYWIKQADILHVSILGNDLLQVNMGESILHVAQDDYGPINEICEKALENVVQIVAKLKEYNPTATLFFQNVYNPMFENSTLIGEDTKVALAALDITTSEQYRALGQILLGKLNGVLTDYLAEHPGDFIILDANAEFDRIAKEDISRGAALIFKDWVHPSSEGHAVLADLTQQKLEELGLADKKSALKKYKTMRNDQLEELYKDSVDVAAVQKQIGKADSCQEVTKIFFDAVRDKTPIYC